MREFTTQARAIEAETTEEQEALDFKIDGHPCKAYPPGTGQLAVMIAMTNKNASTEEAIAGIVNFFVSLLDDDSRNHVINRLLDRRDPFGIENIQEIMQGMTEDWSARPTQLSSGSASSPPTTGPSSTAEAPVLI